MLVEGARGSGKSRLLGAATAALRAGVPAVLEIVGEDAAAPLSSLSAGFERAVAALVRSTAGGAAAVHLALRTAAEGHLAPFAVALSPTIAAAVGPTVVPAMTASAFAEGAAEYVLRVARRVGGVAIVIDDLPRIDPASGEVLARVAARAAEAPVRVVASSRLGVQSELTDRLRALGAEPVTLRDLSEEQTRRLVCSFLGSSDVGDAVARSVAEHADGTAVGVLEVLGTYLDAGAVVRRESAWCLDAPTDALELPDGALALLGHRLGELPPATREVLDVAALIGTTFDELAVQKALRLDEDSVAFSIDEARRTGLVVNAASGERRFIHESLREMVLHQLSERERRALHQRIGEGFWETCRRDRPTLFRIAHHLAQGEIERSPLFAHNAMIEAAAVALDAYDNESALRFLDTARTTASHAKVALDADYYRSLGEAKLRLGDLPGSLGAFEAALDRATSRLDRASILGRISWVHQAAADAALAWEALDRAFTAAGARMPTEAPGAMATTLTELAWSELRRVRPGADPRSLDPEMRALLCELHYQNARLGAEYGKPLRFLQSCLEALDLSRALGPSLGAVRAHAFYGLLLTMIGAPERGARRLDFALELASTIQQPSVMAYCEQIRGVTAAWAGEFDDALARIDRCLGRYAPWLELNEYCLLATSAEAIEALRGRPREARRWIDTALGRVRRAPFIAPGLGRSLGLHAASTITALGGAWQCDAWLAHLVAAELPEGDRGKFHRMICWSPRARLLLEQDATDEAVDALVEAYAAEGYSTRVVHPILLEYYVSIAHARVESCLRAPSEPRRARLRALRRAAEDLRAVAKLPLVRGHRLLVDGWLAALEGNPRRASKLFEEARQVAERERCVWVLSGVARAEAHLLRESGR
ncbi:MAG TPA: AAA family ATPase, partial [Minicystis sp.]|nr:AAA family ATPase [Minicystis sp.]